MNELADLGGRQLPRDEGLQPSPLPVHARIAIHQAVHNVVLQFGFQLFNRNPKNKKDAARQEWIHATEALICHRLEEELEHKYLRTDIADGTRFEASVLRLSATIFTPYQRWQKHVKLSVVRHAQEAVNQKKDDTKKTTTYFLYELALYYLIYAEGANLRHLPELMWFIFWICRHSHRFENLCNLLPEYVCSPQFMVDTDWSKYAWWALYDSSLPSVRHHLRNKYQATIARMARQFQTDENVQQVVRAKGGGELGTSSYYLTVGSTYSVVMGLVEYIRAAVTRLGQDTGEDVALLAEWLQNDDDLLLTTILGELVLYGDGGMFLEKVVQPVFVYLTEQVQLMGGAKEEAGLRVGYDDCNESLCVPEIVHRALHQLRVLEPSSLSGRGVVRIQRDPWDALLVIGDEPPADGLKPSDYRNYPRNVQYLSAEPGIIRELAQRYENHEAILRDEFNKRYAQAKQEFEAKSPEQRREVAAEFKKVIQQLQADLEQALRRPPEDYLGRWQYACCAAEWWRRHVFQKTFVERRSVLMVFRAFFRVYAFHLVVFHILCAFAWNDTWKSRWYYACSSVFTHSVMHALDSAAAIFLFAPMTVVREEEQPLADKERRGNRKPSHDNSDDDDDIDSAPKERIPPRKWRVGPRLYGCNRTRLGLLVSLLLWLGVIVALIVFFASNFRSSLVPKALTNAADALNLDGDKSYVIATAIYAAVWVVYEVFRNCRCGFVLRHITEYLGLPPVEHYFDRSNMSTPFWRFWGNALMWIVIIIMKVAFDYFAVLRPLKKVLDKLNDAGWAIFTTRGWTMDILLVIAQVVPNFLVCLFDTGIFYQLAAAVVGTVYGLLHLRLGQVRSWKHAIAAFVSAPELWCNKCVSKAGFEHIVRVLKRNHYNRTPSVKRTDQSKAGGTINFLNPYDPDDHEATTNLARWVCFLMTWNDIVKSLRRMDLISNKEMGYLLFEEVHADIGSKATGASTPPRPGAATDTSKLMAEGGVSSANTPTGSMTGRHNSLTNVVPHRTTRLFGRLQSKGGQAHAGGDVAMNMPAKPPPPYLLPRFAAAGQIAQMVRMSTFSATGDLVMEQAFDRLIWLMERLNILGDKQSLFLKQLQPSKLPASDAQQATREGLLAEITTLMKHLADKSVLDNLNGALLNRNQQQQAGAPSKWTQLMDKELAFIARSILKIANGLLLEVRFLEETAKSRFLARLYGVFHQQTSYVRILRTIAGHLIQIADDCKQALTGDVDQRRKSALYMRLDEGFRSVVDPRESEAGVQSTFRQLASWLESILSLSEMDAEPCNEEAKRVIQFFLTTLYNPDLKQPKAIHEMKALTTLTPHYEEDVVSALDPQDVEALVGGKLSAGDKKVVTGMALLDEEGNLTESMKYVKTVNATEWFNFQERMLDAARAKGLQNLPAKATDIQEFHFKKDGPLHPLRLHLLLWASVRGQHLSRTCRGMMMYGEALHSMARLEYNLDDPLAATGGARNANTIAAANAVLKVVDRKYRYIITSQVFGQCLSGKKGVKGKWVAKGVQALMNMYPGLRVAYIDSQEHWKVELPEFTKLVNEQTSVLVRAKPPEAGAPPAIGAQDVSLESLAPTEEVYRVRLPLNYENPGMGVVLGEGKPENQNHAIIFCFGELLQTIDMNQDNNLAEAFKVRNLCGEFKMPDRVRRSKKKGAADTTRDLQASRFSIDQMVHTEVKYDVTEDVALVGCREWIFSADSGALADFAATTEFTFGTIVQRVMTYPGAVRFHYGHPDVWNKQYVMTRGGVSKSNKVLHVSEDVFGGYNTVLRGGKIKYVEYISVGKGRDMGFSSINGFEAKIAQGNGEQVMSREVYRLGTGFDFFRLMAWYHTGNGFFINSALTMLSVYVSAWVLLFLSLALEDGIVEQEVFQASAAYSNVQILQLGSFSIIVFLFAMWLERGPVDAFIIILRQFFSGSLLFYVFRAQTTNYYFTTDVKYGGAGYIATGRGYTLSSVPFVTLFQNYARTHMAFGAEVAMLLSLVLIIGAPVPGWSMWAGWLVVIALMFGPFWFNPFVFEISKTRADYVQFSEWTANRVAVNNNTWVQWNRGQLEKARNDSRKQTDRMLTVMREVALSVVSLLLSATAINSLSARTLSTWPLFGIVTFAFIIIFSVWFQAQDRYLSQGLKVGYRMIKTIAGTFFFGVLVLFGVLFVPGHSYRLKNVFIILYANYQLLKLFNTILKFAFPRFNLFRVYSDRIHKVGDIALGHSIFAFLFLMSLFNQVFNLGKLQGVLLFNSTYAQQYITEQEVKGTIVERWYKEFQAERKGTKAAAAAGAETSDPKKKA